jgi:hypothetical protein
MATKDETRARIARDFATYPLTENQTIVTAHIRGLARRLAGLITDVCPAGRETSLALTNLEQVVFWAVASIARTEVEASDPFEVEHGDPPVMFDGGPPKDRGVTG